MALKDWRTIYNKKEYFEFEKISSKLSDYIIGEKNKTNNNWKLSINGKIVPRIFRTKSQALRYAKDYMRKN